MSLRTWLATRFRPSAAGVIPAPAPYWFLFQPWLKEAGVPVTADTAIQVSAVYGCCRFIVDALAAAHVRVVEVKTGGRRETLHDDGVAYTLNWGAPVALAPDAPTSQAIEEALYWSALLWGNGYAEIQRDLAGRFFALWPIRPDRVVPWQDETGFYYRVSAPTSTTGALVGGAWVRIEAKDMFHLRGPSLYGWVGDSAVFRAAKAIGIAQAAQVFSAAYFAHGTVLSGLLTSDKHITQPQADEARAKWEERHGGGPAAQHGISVLGQGMKYQPINHDAQQAQLIEARRFQVHEIARFYGIPTSLLNENESWTDLSAQYLAAYYGALLPWAERFDGEATRKLFPQRQPWREVEHNLDRLTMGSFKDRVSALREATNSGLKTRNEARAALGDNSIGAEGDELVVEKGIQSLDAVLNPPEPVAPTVPKVPPGKPGKAPDMEPMPGEPEPDDRIGPRDLLVAMFADAFARHARRIANHRTNHRGEVAEEDRPALRDRLAEDCRAGLGLCKRALPAYAGSVDLAGFADALEQGEPPDKAAERFIDGVWRAA